MRCYMAHMAPIRKAMRNDIQILINSAAFVGWLFEGDEYYERLGEIFTQLQRRKDNP